MPRFHSDMGIFVNKEAHPLMTFQVSTFMQITHNTQAITRVKDMCIFLESTYSGQ